MLEAQNVSLSEIQAWRNQIENGDLSDVGAVYQQLAKRGYHYAKWAYGVASSDSITGNGALEFMQAIANEHNHILTTDETNKIRRGMALGYLDTLAKKAGSDSVSQDITYKEMREFHIEVFKNNNVDINYWTLYEPMRIIEQYASGKPIGGHEIKGEQVVEEVWEAMWATKGTNVDSWLMSLGLSGIMSDAQNGYIYINKLTGTPESLASITLKAASRDPVTGLLIWSCYKKVPISSADQALAKKWVDNTSKYAPVKDYWVEFGREGLQNLWYKDYASPSDQCKGSYFENQKNTDAAKQQFKFNWEVAGGKGVTKWIIAAVLNTNSINSSDPRINSINDDNFADKGLGFIFDPVNGHRQEIAGQPGKFEFKYQLAFIDELPEKLLSQLQTWEKQGNQQMVSLYLNALMQLNPVVIINPDEIPKVRTINDVGENWIKLRTWMIQEMRFAQAKEYDNELTMQPAHLQQIAESGPLARPLHLGYQQLKSLVESIRVQYGFGKEDTILFCDNQTGQNWCTDPNTIENAHHVVMLAENNTQSYTGGELADVIVGGKGDDVISGNDGNDYLLGGAGNDTLRGGKGNDTLSGGNGMDHYYFNSGDGKDEIYDDDGNGIVYLNNKKFSEYKWRVIAKNLWQSEDDKWRLKLENSGDLNIQSLTDKNDSLTIRQWDIMHGNKLGISFSGGGDPSSTGKNKILGDWRTKIIRVEGYFDMDENKTGLYYPNWKNRNTDGSIVNGIKENGFEDVIHGTDEDDEIYGMGGGDAIDGGFGNDLIFGGDGNDLLTGGGGSDTIKGGNGDDYIYANGKLYLSDRFRPGEHWQMPASGKKLIYAGPNWGIYIDYKDFMIIDGINNTINDAADTGGDFLYGGDGNDYIIGSNLNDYIEGDSEVSDQGDDIVYGMSGNDHIIGGNGNDYLYGDGIISYGFLNSLDGADHGDDYIDGGDGNDKIVGGGGNDVIIGGNGDDRLFGDNDSYKERMLEARYHGSDTIDGGAGNDEIFGGGGDDYLHGGYGNDKIWGDDSDAAGRHSELNGNDHIWGDDGDDYLDGGYGNDNIHGGEDNDLIFGGADNDELYGDNGDDRIYGDNLKENVTVHGNDYIDGGKGNDYLVGGGGDDWIVGGEGNDTLYGDDCQSGFELNTVMAGDDYLSGGAGNDNLIGGYGNDTLDGGTGDDLIIGGGGCDIIYGGEGNDQIAGDFSLAVDTHIDATNDEYNDVIYAGSGDDLVLGQLGDDLIYGGEGNDRLYGDMGEKASEHHPQNNGNDTIFGENGNDYIDGGYGNDYLDGGADNDTIFGGGGNDLIYGGDGHDILIGDASNEFDIDNDGDGDDVIYGGNGNDTIYGGGGNDLLQGDDGDDVIYGGSGDDKLFGGDGDDWLYGGKGNNYLNGGLGNDSFIFKNGDGITTIEDYSGKSTIIVDNLDQLSFTQYEKGIIIHTGILGDAIYLIGCFTDGRKNSLPLDQIIFTDNKKSQTLSDLFSSNLNTIAQKYNQIIDGDSTDNSIWGTENNDLIYGYTGNDILHGGAGNDYIEGGDGNDILYGEDGDDILNGGLGEDTLIGGSGNDILNGGDYEKDIYIFQKGHGHDTVNDRGEQKDPNNVIFENASYSQTQFSRTGVDLIIKAYGTEDSVTFTNYFAGKLYQNFIFNFTDKTLNSEDINKIDYDRNNNHQKSIIKGWKGKDILYGTDGDDELDGGDGDDELYGGDGNDELTGGSGYDIVYGGKGDDIIWDEFGTDRYIFQKGHGHDVIHGYGYSDYEKIDERDPDFENSIDEIEFQGAIFNQARFIRGGTDGDDLIIYAYGTDDSLLIADFFSDPTGRSFRFIFDDKQITLDDIANMIFVKNVYEWATGWRGRDQLEGDENDNDIEDNFGGDDILNGYGGNDYLGGGPGNDIINGGDGDDYLYGNSRYINSGECVDDGDDILDGGKGNDRLYGQIGTDTLIGGSGNDYLAGGHWEKDRYIFQINHGEDIIFDKGYDDIDCHYFSNELIFKGANSQNARFSRSENNLIIYAYNTNDSVTLKNFFESRFHRAFTYEFDDKTLYLEDIVKYLAESSEENVTELMSNLNNQGVYLYSPDKDIFNESYEDYAEYSKVIGTNENDNIEGTYNYANILIGNDGDDYLAAMGNYNVLIGGTGNDIMNNGYSKNTYIFQNGHGQDIINQTDGDDATYYSEWTDELFFQGAKAENVRFIRKGEDLNIQAYDSDDSVTLTSFFAENGHRDYRYIFEDQILYFKDIPKDIFPEKKYEEYDNITSNNHATPIKAPGISNPKNANRINIKPSSNPPSSEIIQNIDSLIELMSQLTAKGGYDPLNAGASGKETMMPKNWITHHYF